MKNKLLTVKEVARILRVTPRTIFNYIESNKLPCVKIGRDKGQAGKVLIQQSDLEDFIEKNKE